MTIVRYMKASSINNISWYATTNLTGWLNWLTCVRQAGTGGTQDVDSSRHRADNTCELPWTLGQAC